MQIKLMKTEKTGSKAEPHKPHCLQKHASEPVPRHPYTAKHGVSPLPRDQEPNTENSGGFLHVLDVHCCCFHQTSEVSTALTVHCLSLLEWLTTASGIMQLAERSVLQLAPRDLSPCIKSPVQNQQCYLQKHHQCLLFPDITMVPVVPASWFHSCEQKQSGI